MMYILIYLKIILYTMTQNNFNFLDFCILQEIRSNPTLNKKKSISQTLKDIQVANKGKLVFGRFTDTPKAGINPHSGYSSTPRGIYAYPLDHIIKNLKGDHVNVAFQAEKRYLVIFSINTERVWNIQRGKTSPFAADVIKAASDFIISNKKGLGLEDSLVKNSSAVIYKVLRNNLYPNEIATVLKQAKLPVAVDYTGTIHPADPVQAWFYDSSVMGVIDIIDLHPYEENKQILKVDLVMDFSDIPELLMPGPGEDEYDMEQAVAEIVNNLSSELINTQDPLVTFKPNKRTFDHTVNSYELVLNNKVKVRARIYCPEDKSEDNTVMSMALYGTVDSLMHTFKEYAKNASVYHPEQFLTYIKQRNK